MVGGAEKVLKEQGRVESVESVESVVVKVEVEVELYWVLGL